LRLEVAESVGFSNGLLNVTYRRASSEKAFDPAVETFPARAG
jgi:hypothetical protein